MKFKLAFSKYEIYLFSYIFLINTYSYFLFKLDKKRAINRKNRISENKLIFLCLIGGSSGGLMSMVHNKHKLSKAKFYKGLPLTFILNFLSYLFILNTIRLYLH